MKPSTEANRGTVGENSPCSAAVLVHEPVGKRLTRDIRSEEVNNVLPADVATADYPGTRVDEQLDEYATAASDDEEELPYRAEVSPYAVPILTADEPANSDPPGRRYKTNMLWHCKHCFTDE